MNRRGSNEREDVAPLETLCRDWGVAALFAFGSRAAEAAERLAEGRCQLDPSNSADLDIGVFPHTGRHWDVRDKVRLAAELEDLFGIGRVDLVVLPEASAFLAVEVVSGELLFDASPADTDEYVLYVLRRAGDLLPFERYRRSAILTGGEEGGAAA